MKKTINKYLLQATKKEELILQIVLITSSIGILFIFCYWIVVYKIIAAKRLKENQIAWNEYSKNMSKSEKDACYLEWCNERKMKMGWSAFYFPQK